MPVALFDVNETLLDLAALDPAFERAFGDAGARRSWFATLKELFLTQAVVGRYDDFAALARAALDVEAARRPAGLRPAPLADADRDAVLDGLKALPAHPEVDTALGRLAGAGWRLVALTNGTPEAVARQLDHAGIAGRFEAALSVDAVGRYKPAPEPYRWACEHVGVAPADAWMVAAHAWDLAGARSVGLRTAFVARGAGWPSVYAPPAVTGRTLAEVADQLLAAG